MNTVVVAASQPDYIAIAMVAVMALIVMVMVIRKHMLLKKRAAKNTVEEVSCAQEAELSPAPKAPGSAGEVKLYDVEPRTAAMLMAIVADTMGVPLNELRFISVREVK